MASRLLNIGPAPKCGAPQTGSRGPCTSTASTPLGTCGIASHIKWGQAQADLRESQEDPKGETPVVADGMVWSLLPPPLTRSTEEIRCLATAGNDQRCIHAREPDKLTCVRREHRAQEEVLQAKLVAENYQRENQQETVISSQPQRATEARASAEPFPEPDLGQRSTDVTTNHGDLNSPNTRSSSNLELLSIAELLERNFEEWKDSIRDLNNLKDIFISHSRRLEDLERAPSHKQPHRTVEQNKDSVERVENLKEQLIESLHSNTQAVADLTARVDAFDERLVSFKKAVKTELMEKSAGYNAKINQLSAASDRLRDTTKQAFTIDEAVVDSLATELRTHIASSPAHSERQITENLDKLAESFKTFKDSTVQMGNTRDNRLNLIKQKVNGCIEDGKKQTERSTQLEDAVAVKLVSDAEIKTLKSTTESMEHRLETVAQQQSQDRKAHRTRLEALEQRRTTPWVTQDTVAPQPGASKSQGTSGTLEKQQEDQVWGGFALQTFYRV